MINSQDFAKRLEKILDFYGLSATAFSDKIDFNRSTISHLLSGRNKPSLEFIIKVLQQFPEVELYWLINGKGSFPSTPSKTENSIPLPDRENDEVQQTISISESHKFENKTASHKSEIDRIVIFYKDGSFKLYE